MDDKVLNAVLADLVSVVTVPVVANTTPILPCDQGYPHCNVYNRQPITRVLIFSPNPWPTLPSG